jgi:hypothetical protein
MNARCITLLQEVKVFEFTPKQYAIMALHIAKIYYDQKCNQPDDVGSRDVWKFWMDAYSSDFNQLVKVAYSIRECYYTYKSEFSSRLLFRTAQLVYMSTQENQPRKIIMTMIFDRLQDCMDYIKTPLTSDALITTIEGVIRDFDNGIV